MFFSPLKQFSPLRHRLFWKIILIFWLTTILTIVANILITKEIVVNEFKVEQLRDKMQLLANEATQVYENQGAKPLKQWYRKLARREGIRVILLSNDETPIIHIKPKHRLYEDHDDHDRHDRYEDHGYRPTPNILKLADQYVTSSSGNAYILRVLPSPYIQSRFNPEHLHTYRLSASFLIILLGSLWIARSIARPIRILHEASIEIAKGKLDVRVSSEIGRRKDELGQLAQAFDGMTDTISELLNNQQQLFRDISHEIRTPLTRQKLAIELARSSHQPEALLDKIESQNENIEELITQLLTLMQADNGSELLQKQDLSLSNLIERTITEAELDLATKNLHIASKLSYQGTLCGDQVLLTRALENLLVNAIKYSPENSEILISTQQEDEELLIELSDQGPGIPEAELKDILKPFYRADKSRNRGTGGFGLGLAITHRIIQQHEGSMSLTNREPRGLRVSIRLPLTKLD